MVVDGYLHLVRLGTLSLELWDMPSERIQRQIDLLIDEAEEAVGPRRQRRW